MESGHYSTQNRHGHLTEDTNKMADGVSVLSLGWHQGLA